MASTEPSSQTSRSREPLELPQWQYEEFSQKMQQWQTAIDKNGECDGLSGAELPKILKCFAQHPKAAFHFQSIAIILIKWQGDYVREPFDGLAWMRDEEPKIFFRLKRLMLSMESDFENDKFPHQTCVMEHESILRAFRGRDKFAVPNSIQNHLDALAVCLENDRHSKWWEAYSDTCENIYSPLVLTSNGLQELLDRHEKKDSTSDILESVETPGGGETRTEQSKDLTNNAFRVENAN